MLQGEKNREKAKLTQHHEKNAEALQWDCKTMKIKYINSIFINRTYISRYIVFSYDGLSFKGPKDDMGWIPGCSCQKSSTSKLEKGYAKWNASRSRFFL